MIHNAQVVKIDDLAQAKALFDQLGVAPEGVKILAPKALYFGVKLTGVPLRAANILKQNMLVYGGDVAVSKEAYYLNAETTDLVILGTLKHFEQLCLSLNDMQLDLPCIAEEIRETLVKYESYAQVLRIGDVTFSLSECTVIMGILNVTPDSFADGGKHGSVEAAINHGLRMAEEGADIIDVGGESTRPGADSVGVEEELRRVIPVVEGLAARADVPISIDTYRHGVAERAIGAGASMVNDISGLRSDRKMARLVADRNVPVVIMHMQGTPKNMQNEPEYKDVTGEIIGFLHEQTEYAIREGVLRENIIIDPGIGFGKNLDHNLRIMNRISEFRSLGFPILIGPSRKSFIGLTLDLPVEERLEGTAATVAYAIAQGANILRVHDIKEMVRVARMADAMVRG